jgi:hypothetical protein
MHYDFSHFHPKCLNRGLIRGDDGIHVYCLDCGISANLEGVSAKVSAADAAKTKTEIGENKRSAIGTLSEGIVR